MRLTDEQIRAIHETTEQMFGVGSCVYLFGSRADDTRRGGDIDLLVETDQVIESHPSAATRFAAKLQRRLGDRRIDILIGYSKTERQPIHNIARNTGIAP